MDHKPPGVYLLNAAGQVVLPGIDPWLVSSLLSVAFTAAAVLVVQALLRRRLPAGAAWGWSLACCVGIAAYPVALGGGLTESFAVLPLVAALWAVTSTKAGWRYQVAIGIALGCAGLLSLESLPAIAVLAAASVISGERAGLLGRLAGILAGGAILPLVVVGWLAAAGGLGAALDEIVTYSFAYRASQGQFLDVLPTVGMVFGCLALPVAVEIGAMVRRPRYGSRAEWVCAVWSAAYLAYMATQGRMYLHYLILLIDPSYCWPAPAWPPSGRPSSRMTRVTGAAGGWRAARSRRPGSRCSSRPSPRSS